jgi:hypothetical protein
MKKIEANYDRYLLEWKKRKQGCLDIVDTISEGMDLNRKDFMAMVGMETDEDYGVMLPSAKR